MATQVILLEKVDHLGNMGDVVSVKPGYARNFLLPQSKALRATKDNIAYFEAQKSALEKVNNEKKGEAETISKKIKDLQISIIRQASESGQLYGSVTSRDIADSIAEQTKEMIERRMVALNQNFKTIGLFPVEIALHPEVKVHVTVNIARSQDEAEVQAKSGKVLISGNRDVEEQADTDDVREKFIEEGALAAQKAREAEEAEKAAEEAAKTDEKAAARAEKKAAAQAEAAAAEQETAEDGEAEMSSDAEDTDSDETKG